MSTNSKSFLILIKDDDKGVFNVIGPITDDSDLNSRVVQEQENGRKVRCESIRNAIKEELIRRVPSELNLKYDPDFNL